MVEERKKELLKKLGYLGIFVIVMVLTIWVLPPFALFTGGGAEKQFNIELVELFQALGGGFLIGIVIFKLIFIIGNIISKKANRFIGWTNIPVLNFENSLLFAIGKGLKVEKFIRLVGNPLRQFWWGLILFSGLGVFAIQQNTFLAEIPEMQISRTAETILSTFPASSSEFLLIMFSGGTIFGLMLWFKEKFKWDEVTFWFINTPSIVVVMTLAHLTLHFTRYGESELSLISVGLFGFLSSILYLLFGGFMISWLLHPSNNFFFFMNKSPFFSDETVILVFLAFIIPSLILIGIVGEVIALRRRKRKKGTSKSE